MTHGQKIIKSKINVPVLTFTRRWPFHHTALNTNIVREAETKTRRVNIEYHVNMVRYIYIYIYIYEKQTVKPLSRN